MRYAYAVGLQGLGLSIFMSLVYSSQLITPAAALSEQLSVAPVASATQGKSVDSPLFRETASFSLPLLEPYAYEEFDPFLTLQQSLRVQSASQSN